MSETINLHSRGEKPSENQVLEAIQQINEWKKRIREMVCHKGLYFSGIKDPNAYKSDIESLAELWPQRFKNKCVALSALSNGNNGVMECEYIDLPGEGSVMTTLQWLFLEVILDASWYPKDPEEIIVRIRAKLKERVAGHFE